MVRAPHFTCCRPLDRLDLSPRLDTIRHWPMHFTYCTPLAQFDGAPHFACCRPLTHRPFLAFGHWIRHCPAPALHVINTTGPVPHILHANGPLYRLDLSPPFEHTIRHWPALCTLYHWPGAPRHWLYMPIDHWPRPLPMDTFHRLSRHCPN